MANKVGSFFYTPLNECPDLKSLSIFSDADLDALTTLGIGATHHLIGKFMMLDCDKKAFVIFLDASGVTGSKWKGGHPDLEDIADIIAYKTDLLLKN